MMAHLLASIDYQQVDLPSVELPERPVIGNYQRPERELSTYVDDHVSTLLGDDKKDS